MIGIPLGLVYANASEWLIHKYLLHGRGRKPGSWWSFHIHEHHLAASQLDMRDPAYDRWRWRLDAQTREAIALAAAAAVQIPLIPVAPFFAATVLYSIGNYYRVHKKAHLDPAWAREHLPWHVDHHMGPDPDKNWCVTKPWFDRILGTREPWVGTPQEAEQLAKQAAKKAAATS